MHWDAQLDDGRGELLFGRRSAGSSSCMAPCRAVRDRAPRSRSERRGPGRALGSRHLRSSLSRDERTRGRPSRCGASTSTGAPPRELRDARSRGPPRENRAGARCARAPASAAASAAPPPASRASCRKSRSGRVSRRCRGHVRAEFLQLPEEVLTTTMIHHQHFFPVVNEHGRLLPAFLAVVNTEPDDSRLMRAKPRTRPRGPPAGRQVLLGRRLPDDARGAPAAAGHVLFHKRLGSYRAKALRIEALAGWVASDVLARPRRRRRPARQPGWRRPTWPPAWSAS